MNEVNNKTYIVEGNADGVRLQIHRTGDAIMAFETSTSAMCDVSEDMRTQLLGLYDKDYIIDAMLDSKDSEILRVFDVLFMDGKDIRRTELKERKEKLQGFKFTDEVVYMSHTVAGTKDLPDAIQLASCAGKVLVREMSSVYGTGKSSNWMAYNQPDLFNLRVLEVLEAGDKHAYEVGIDVIRSDMKKYRIPSEMMSGDIYKIGKTRMVDLELQVGDVLSAKIDGIIPVSDGKHHYIEAESITLLSQATTRQTSRFSEVFEQPGIVVNRGGIDVWHEELMDKVKFFPDEFQENMMRGSGKLRPYTIQQHVNESSSHFDLRLDLGGFLESFELASLPIKGPVACGLRGTESLSRLDINEFSETTNLTKVNRQAMIKVSCGMFRVHDINPKEMVLQLHTFNYDIDDKPLAELRKYGRNVRINAEQMYDLSGYWVMNFNDKSMLFNKIKPEIAQFMQRKWVSDIAKSSLIGEEKLLHLSNNCSVSDNINLIGLSSKLGVSVETVRKYVKLLGSI